jgi:hypothetical protein
MLSIDTSITLFFSTCQYYLITISYVRVVFRGDGSADVGLSFGGQALIGIKLKISGSSDRLGIENQGKRIFCLLPYFKIKSML